MVVATTEHTHAYACLPALQRKLPVYCEKPLTHNVKEAAIIIEAAATMVKGLVFRSACCRITATPQA